MDVSVTRVADDWIELQRYDDVEKAPEAVFERGWVLNDLAYDEPELAWDVIKSVIGRYDDTEVFNEQPTEARRILGMTAAGPLEDLLANHGPRLIERVEDEAKRDRRMSWALGCVWKNSMTDDVWTRVQRAAGGISR
jgi:hypothetical protein